jgi:hypothetical protein
VVEANTCYFRGEKAIYAAVPDKTPNGRPWIVPKMKWGTNVKFVYKSRAISVASGG